MTSDNKNKEKPSESTSFLNEIDPWERKQVDRKQEEDCETRWALGFAITNQFGFSFTNQFEKVEKKDE